MNADTDKTSGGELRLRTFISYRRQDSAPYAGRLYDDLCEHFGAAQVFMDVDTTEIGADYERVIVETIERADVLVAVVGPNWLAATDDRGRRRLDSQDDFVRRELELALNGNARVIPVLVQEAVMPAAGELPPSIAAFAHRQALIMSDRRWRADVAELVRALDGLVARKATKAWSVQEQATATAVGPTALRRSRRASLPFHRTRFIGRDEDVQRIRNLLASTGFVTIVGPGGVGKSRLAVEVARSIEGEYQDGVYLAGLASVEDPALVVQAVIRATDGDVDERDSTLDSLVDRLAGRRLLLILDNCEHLIDEAATVTEAIVQRCPNLHVLATSREALQVEGEAVWRLAPLGTPQSEQVVTAADLADSPAAMLFADRAALAASSFTLDDRVAPAVARIVVALDGLPLALELAAASLRSVDLESVVNGLSNPSPTLADRRTSQTRQRTMWATIDWSYQLLDGTLRTVLERLAVFAGSFTTAHAEVVCGSGWPPGAVTPAIVDLVDHSLVSPVEDGGSVTRFRLLYAVRDYARGRLRARADDPTTSCLQRWAAEVARVNGRAVDVGDELTGLSILDAEHPNLLAALALAKEESSVAVVGDVASSLTPYWELRGLRAEGLKWVEWALEVSIDDDALHAKCCLAAERLAATAEFDVRRRRATEALTAADRAGDDATAGSALATLAHIDLETNQTESARRHLDAALIRARSAADDAVIAVILLRLADCERDEHDTQNFEQLLNQATELYVKLGNRRGQLWSLAELGFARALANDLEGATAAYEQGLRLARELGYPHGQAWMHDALGETDASAGRYEASRTHFEEAHAIQLRMGDELNRGWTIGGLIRAHVRLRELDPALHWLAEFAEYLHDDLAPLHEYAFLLRAGSVAVLSGQTELAGRILGALDGLEVPASLSPTDQDDKRKLAEEAIATLGPRALAEASQRGDGTRPRELVRELLDACLHPPPAHLLS
jgi:predicted ATPase